MVCDVMTKGNKRCACRATLGGSRRCPRPCLFSGPGAEKGEPCERCSPWTSRRGGNLKRIVVGFFVFSGFLFQCLSRCFRPWMRYFSISKYCRFVCFLLDSGSICMDCNSCRKPAFRINVRTCDTQWNSIGLLPGLRRFSVSKEGFYAGTIKAERRDDYYR